MKFEFRPAISRPLSKLKNRRRRWSRFTLKSAPSGRWP